MTIPATFALPMFERSLWGVKAGTNNERERERCSLQEGEEIEQGYEWEEMDVHPPQYAPLPSVIPPVAPVFAFITRARARARSGTFRSMFTDKDATGVVVGLRGFLLG